MSVQNPGRASFATLDKEKGLPESPPASGEEYPLPAWYRSIRDVPLDELGIEDISKAIRQNIHLENVVPLALRRLQTEPLAGEMYEGELLASFKCIPADYWSKHPTERQSLNLVISAVLQEAEVTDTIRQDADELLHTVA
ncbi:MAG TPA: contact-dependent growth inhibition system immunity protein [Verrucomicrobiae bacterium]|jgi:hypothetical protein